MRTRPRRGALGLRGRIVGLVLFTTVATLAVAALALLGPLESKLRHSALTTFEHEVGSAPARPFKGLPLANLATSFAVQRRLVADETQLGSRVGGVAYIYGYPAVTGQAQLQPYLPAAAADIAPSDPATDVMSQFLDGKQHGAYGFGTINGDQYAEHAVRFTTPAPPGSGQKEAYWVLAVRKRIDEVPAAVSAVRKAFLTAALAGLVLTLILGIPLSGTLVRRLRRLRQAALLLASEGPTGKVRVPVDRARDEVGDLARTFAIMQRQLQHQEEARRAFVATASHELRTPLASLDGMLELLDDDLRSGEPDLDEARALLERARAQSRRLARLAADLLDLSRLDAEVKLRSEPVELSELSRAVLAEFELGTTERSITPVLEIPDGQVWALGDPGSIARILRILLDNAVRMSPEGSEVTVELVGEQGAELSVCDRGPGIAPEERSIIFERFQRGRDTAGQAGFGLGLAIGRELAERMRGELVLDETYGPGAKFTLRLPVAQAREVPPLTVG
jgi:signal transduction histidine kinase